MPFAPRAVFGVDFSGARLAGRTIWIAELDISRCPRLLWLDPLERLAGCADRDPCLAHLVALIRASRDALWAIDAPFCLPVELLPPRAGYSFVLNFARNWKDGAHAIGLHYLSIAKKLGGPNHLRRLTDSESKTPFSCYHYRIAYQTFHVQRDVLFPLLNDSTTCALPFQGSRLAGAQRVLVEACPSSTLKHLGLPHQNYKQPQGGPITARRRRTRRIILDRLASLIEIPAPHLQTMHRDPGGDAIDSVLAALGALLAWQTYDHAALARDPRRRREGVLYAGPIASPSSPQAACPSPP